MIVLPQPIWRTLGVTLVMVGLAIGLAPVSRAADDTPLDGRLGGTYASFVQTYGDAVDVNPSIGEIFSVDGYGLVAAQFSRKANAQDDDAPALLITLSSERPESVPASQADPADWSLDEANQRAAEFAPADAEIGDFQESPDGSLLATCTSDALTGAFGTLTGGGCTIRAVKSGDESVSFITLSLAEAATGGPATPAAGSDCNGASTWAQASGKRMNTALDLLGRLADVDADAPSASDDLTTIAQSFSDLAADQRSAETPSAATTANFYLIGSFSEFGSAVKAIAAAIEANDGDAVDAAVSQIDDAKAKYQRASDEIEQIVSDCQLEVASPVAGP